MPEEIKLVVAISGMALFSFIVALANASEQSYSAGVISIRPTVITEISPDVTSVVTEPGTLPSTDSSDTGIASPNVTNMTNQFGRYTIDHVPVGATYPVEPSHEQFGASSRSIRKKNKAADRALTAE